MARIEKNSAPHAVAWLVVLASCLAGGLVGTQLTGRLIVKESKKPLSLGETVAQRRQLAETLLAETVKNFSPAMGDGVQFRWHGETPLAVMVTPLEQSGWWRLVTTAGTGAQQQRLEAFVRSDGTNRAELLASRFLWR